MKSRAYNVCVLLLGLMALCVSPAIGIDVTDTRMLSQPAVSRDHIAFVYSGDLWIAGRDGKGVRRLTSHEGVESNPVFSPDGQFIAFDGQYDGNTDVYIIPADGGVPKRLTWHPGADQVRDFTPDGTAVLFISSRDVFTYAFNQLFTVPVTGGLFSKLEIPNAFRATYSPDGKRMAYVPLREVFHQWKRYRGGTHSEIWIYAFKDHSVEKIPQPEGRCNDTDPMWIGNSIFFRSDRNGEFNIFIYDLDSKKMSQLTHFLDFPVIRAAEGTNQIIFEQAGYLHILDPSIPQTKKLTIGIATDLLEVRSRYVKGAGYIRSADLSPSGARAVFGFRGEVVTVPAEKGDPRNLTKTVGIHDRVPIWSPDGRSIAYATDASGEYELHIRKQDGLGDLQKFKLKGAGFYDNFRWSPDSKKICYTDNSFSLFWLDLETGNIKKIGSEYYYGPFKTIQGMWSPDSKWIAYTLNTQSYFQKIYIYSLDQDKSSALTDGLSEVGSPIFDKSGKYLYFFASTDAGPVKHWFAMSNADLQMTSAIYLAVLQKGVKSPLAKESDEEKAEESKTNSDDKKAPAEKPEEEKKEEPFKIDFQGIENRILNIPIKPGNYFNLRVGTEGQIYYLEAPQGGSAFSRETKLHMYDMKSRKDEVLGEGITTFTLSDNGKKLLYMSGGQWSIAPAGKLKPGQGRLKLDAVEIPIDPREEWKQIFDESWRINRDYFYDPDFHGTDWEAMKTKYEQFLPDLSCRSDLNRLIQWMCSELSVGHHRVGGGDILGNPTRISGGLLGADYSIENGRYRLKKIYGGLNWNPQLRSPLTEPGVDAREGEYLLAVHGRELKSPMNLFSLFENTAGKLVEIKLGPNPNGIGSRTVQVVPVSSEYALRNRDWVEGNIKKVDEATGGRVAYVYVPNTTGLGYVYFKRYFFPQSHKDAIIIDERFNGGGQVADYYIDILQRPYMCHWATRYGHDIKTPSASIQGPKVMLIDENAGSGGDLLPWMFRKMNMGKLIGKRTWGGLVGTLGFPVLMDGGIVTAPNLAIWTEEGFIVENVGIPPDIEVEQWPAEVIKGRDPQLEKAIQVILEDLKKNPPKKYKKPGYPKK